MSGSLSFRRLVAGDEYDAEAKVSPQIVPFDELPPDVQEAEIAGLIAMSAALLDAERNRITSDSEFELLKAVAVPNANTYLEVGDELGLEPSEQPSDMLLWGSILNVVHHIEILRQQDKLQESHLNLVKSGMKRLKAAAGTPSKLPDANPNHRNFDDPLPCEEADTEHGLLTAGALHLLEAVTPAFDEAVSAGYCDRCIAASQLGHWLRIVIAGGRAEGRSNEAVMVVISDLIAHAFDKAERETLLPHQPRAVGEVH